MIGHICSYLSRMYYIINAISLIEIGQDDCV